MEIFSLALRYLRTRTIAIVSLGFVAVGVSANIIVNAIFDGFRLRLQSHVRAASSDLTLDFTGYRMRDHFRIATERLAGEMADAGGPIAALSPRQRDLGLAVRLTRDGRYSQLKSPVYVLGVDWAKERMVTPLDSLLTNLRPEDEYLRVPAAAVADPFKDRSMPGVVLGVSLAKALEVEPGSEIDLFAPDLEQIGGGERIVAGNVRFQVVGCFESGNDEHESWMVYISREHFQLLKGDRPMRDAKTIHARLVDYTKADEVKARLMRDYASSGLRVRTWEDENRNFLQAVGIERAMIVIILSIILLVAAGSILGILWMLVLEKTRDIGVLRSMGLSAGRTVLVFITVGALLGLVGSLTGLVLGVGIVKNLNTITGWLNSTLGIEVFNPKIYKFKQIPTALLPEWVAGVTVGAFLCAVLASLIPAWLAARLDPVKCLKHE